MRIAFVGKGGAGKTTLSALFSQFVAAQGLPVLAIDADINQHLAESLGATAAEAASIPPLGQSAGAVKEFVRGRNKRIPVLQHMLKTTPPGTGSQFVQLHQPNPLLSEFSRTIRGVPMIAVGPFAEEDLGVACYHSKVGAAEILLNHLLDRPTDYVVMDMTAGADAFASGLFTKFDLTVLVVEPTKKSVGVYEQYRQYARDFPVRLAVLGNKVADQSDVDFLRQQVGEHLLGWLGVSPHIRQLEKGDWQPVKALEPENQAALLTLLRHTHTLARDWEEQYRQTVNFHRRNAAAWANAQLGVDVTTQIDPQFDIRRAVEAHRVI